MRIISQKRDFNLDAAETIIAIGSDIDESGQIGPRVKILAELPSGKMYPLGEYGTEARAQGVFDEIAEKMTSWAIAPCAVYYMPTT